LEGGGVRETREVKVETRGKKKKKKWEPSGKPQVDHGNWEFAKLGKLEEKKMKF